MKKLIFSTAIIAVILAGCGGEEETVPATDIVEEITAYTIEEDRVDGSIWKVVINTADTDEEKLKAHIENVAALAADKDEKIDSVFVNVKITDSVANTYAASGKVAFTDKGRVQTGLENLNEFEFNISLNDTHDTSKEDLPQSTASYNAETVLKAFQDAGLPTTDSRDNSHNCVSLECTTLITTEDISIYEWPSVEKAQEVQEKYTFGDAQLGTIIIRLNNSSLDVQPYIDALNEVIK